MRVRIIHFVPGEVAIDDYSPARGGTRKAARRLTVASTRRLVRLVNHLLTQRPADVNATLHACGWSVSVFDEGR